VVDFTILQTLEDDPEFQLQMINVCTSSAVGKKSYLRPNNVLLMNEYSLSLFLHLKGSTFPMLVYYNFVGPSLVLHKQLERKSKHLGTFAIPCFQILSFTI